MKMFALVHKIFAYCNIRQVGGKDQLGNIVAGQEMISKEVDKEVWGVNIYRLHTIYSVH